MVYLPASGHLPLPEQDPFTAASIADRFLRAAEAQEDWATRAKECIDFLEGRQWSEADKAKLEAEGRPALVFNMLAPLFRLVTGYHRNNQTDVSYLPSFDGSGIESVAEVLSKTYKALSEGTGLEFTDQEVFTDGISTGRGFYDFRLSFDDNDLGEICGSAVDPHSVYLDPDGNTYDLNKSCAYVMTSRWVSLDQVEFSFGNEAANMVGSIVRGNAMTEFPTNFFAHIAETRPLHTFGNREDGDYSYLQERWIDFIDTARKNIRLVESQYQVMQRRRMFIDLETGDRKAVPDHWDEQKIAKVMHHAERLGNPLHVAWRMDKRIRWTTMIGDLIIYDNWSPYDTYTLVPFFPYFRRGQTRGMLDDLLDPQREKNKRRSAEIDIVGRTANTGWLYHENSLSPEEEANLRQLGSSPGVQIKWKGDGNQKPEKISPSPPPTAMERLEQKAEDDIRKLSGINEATLGELDRVQSGRAIEARQRQAVLGLQTYMDNFRRTTHMKGGKILNMMQRHYTEQRIFRYTGEDGKQAQVIINQSVQHPDQPTVVDRINDVTLGKYGVRVDETPMSASFRNAQFEEALLILEKMAPALGANILGLADILIDMSSLPRKEEFKSRVQMMLGTTPALPAPGDATGGDNPTAQAAKAASDGAAMGGGTGGSVIPFERGGGAA